MAAVLVGAGCIGDLSPHSASHTQPTRSTTTYYFFSLNSK